MRRLGLGPVCRSDVGGRGLPGARRHPREQRGHHARQHSGAPQGRGLAGRDGYEPAGSIQHDAGRRPWNDEAAKWPHHQYSQRGRLDGEPRTGQLCGVKGRSGRLHEVRRPGAGGPRGPGQCSSAGVHRDGYDRRASRGSAGGSRRAYPARAVRYSGGCGPLPTLPGRCWWWTAAW